MKLKCDKPFDQTVQGLVGVFIVFYVVVSFTIGIILVIPYIIFGHRIGDDTISTLTTIIMIFDAIITFIIICIEKS